jgi:hypothetical protein
MGLDQYLEKHIFIGAEFEHRAVIGSIKLKVEGKPVKIDMKKVSEIVERAAYWRKANAIHAWFVQNVQEGEDDCGDYYVSDEDLQKLLGDVEMVIASLTGDQPTKTIQVETGWKGGETTYADIEVFTNTEIAEKLLPTQDGFFFGSTEYDQYYLEDLEYTRDILTEILNDLESWDVSYYYTSSW